MISLIIAVYKNVKALDLILQSLAQQTYSNFEVIIAEDGEDHSMKACFEHSMHTYRFPIRHVKHEDRGFRKIIIGNEAVRFARGEYVVFIDGDCVLHPRFIEEYHKAMKPGGFYFGRRVLLGPKTTSNLYTKATLSIPSVLSLLFSDSTQVREALYLPFLSPKQKINREIWGCN